MIFLIAVVILLGNRGSSIEDDEDPSYGIKSHCFPSKSQRVKMEAWVNMILRRRCKKNDYSRVQPLGGACLPSEKGHPVSLVSLHPKCRYEMGRQLAEEWLSWQIDERGQGLCNFSQYEVPPLARDALIGDYDFVYYVVAYKDIAQTLRQMRALWSKKNLLIYQIDRKVDRDYESILRKAASFLGANVHIVRTGNIHYLSTSTSWLQYRAMVWLISSEELHFSHMIALDAAAYPIASHDTIRRSLHGPKKLHASFVGARDFGPQAASPGTKLRKPLGFNVLADCTTDRSKIKSARLTLDVREILFYQASKNYSASSNPSEFYTHSDVLHFMRKNWIKSFTGCAAIYDYQAVQLFVHSPKVKHLFAYLKYGYNSIEEHLWALALLLIGRRHDLEMRKSLVFMSWLYDQRCLPPEEKNTMFQLGSPRNIILTSDALCCSGPHCASYHDHHRNQRAPEGIKDALRVSRHKHGRLFARKFDSVKSASLLDWIDHTFIGVTDQSFRLFALNLTTPPSLHAESNSSSPLSSSSFLFPPQNSSSSLAANFSSPKVR